MLSYQEALDKILSLASPPGVEEVALMEACGRVLAGAVPAPWDLPRFDNSAMDGFAMRAEEVRPGVAMPLAGESAAGIPFAGVVGPGEAIRISTGAEIPAGLDAVVPVEKSSVEGDAVTFADAPLARQYIRHRGADVREGQSLFEKGRFVSPEVLSFLSSYNIPAVRVFRRPKVAILTSGEEIVPHGAPLPQGHIVGSSLYYLDRELSACGCETRIIGIAHDTVDSFAGMLKEALEFADIVVSTAGVSVGEHDIVGPAIERLNGKTHFWKVAVRPGKPMMVATYGDKVHFGLPGNPVSTCCNTEIFIKPFLRKVLSSNEAMAGTLQCRLMSECPHDRKRLFFVYGTLSLQSGEPEFRPLSNQNSGNLLNPAMANAMAVVSPGETSPPAGGYIQVVMLRSGL